MAPINEMLKISLKHNQIILYSSWKKDWNHNRGWFKFKKSKIIKKILKSLKTKIRSLIYVELKISDIKIAKDLNADCVEIHTGKICNLLNKNKNIKKEFIKIKTAVRYANMIGLEVCWAWY